MDNYLKEDLLKENVKEKIKLLYKDIVIEDIKEEIVKSKNEVLENINDRSNNKKINKEILNKLDQLLIMVDMIENREEKDINIIAKNNKIILILNIIIFIFLTIGFFI
ncbi:MULTISPECIES: hypothetical protein [unclassified Clostridium]|uniref:hypothetical protein n=1 Tax=unclassified Clostridium TaxID=2614128 RepID=UPI0025C5DD33|nr:hypothetical protein [Clostridium sp.]MCI6691605.1 hypothetical protein [Clostridium sp.]MDY4251862.1 hypothetical protein [Clostridium sp.]MDY6226414.1 hypothetical protein [Clostridium sp.]